MPAQKKEPIQIDLKNLAVYEAGAVLLTTLLFSEPGDTDDDRGGIHASLCKWAIGMRSHSDGEWAQSPALIKPYYATWPEATMNRDIKRMNKRMRNRMIAAKIVIPFLKQTETGQPVASELDVSRLTINKMAEHVLPLSNETEVANLKSRVWAPSRPVLHLAAAVEALRQRFEKLGEVMSYEDMLWQKDLIAHLVRKATSYIPLFEKASKNKLLKLDISLLIPVNLIE